MTTGFNVFRLFVVTLASLWFAVTTPYGRMVEGLNWALAYGKKKPSCPSIRSPSPYRLFFVSFR